jgi:hypothetical protein
MVEWMVERMVERMVGWMVYLYAWNLPKESARMVPELWRLWRMEVRKENSLEDLQSNTG